MLGVVNLYSATSVYTGARAELYISQVYWLVVGGILGGIVVAIDYRHLERLGYVLYAVGVFSLILVFILGRDIRGSARWIEFGSVPLPAERVHEDLPGHRARQVPARRSAERGPNAQGSGDPRGAHRHPGAARPAQPDLGTAIILVLIFVTIASLTRVRCKSVLALRRRRRRRLLPIVCHVRPPALPEAHRITSFLTPRPTSCARVGTRTTRASPSATAGCSGKGFMHGTQNQFLFLPDQHTDFPFPVFAEEWGFVGSVVLIGLYGFLVLWAIRIASLAKDRFGAVLAVGVRRDHLLARGHQPRHDVRRSCRSSA